MSATVIGAHAKVSGSVAVVATIGGTDGDLVIEGFVDGTVRASGRLTLGVAAQVTGELIAHDVRIAGKLDRGIRATGVIHLLSTAEVRGDLEAARVVIDDGAIFEGQVKLRRSATAKPAATVSSAKISSAASPAPSTSPPEHEPPSSPPTRAVPELASPGRRRIQRRGS
jgi:cytoskeletal protein CcmA (bactofilin family)